MAREHENDRRIAELQSELQRAGAAERTLSAVAEELLSVDGGTLRSQVASVLDVLGRYLRCDRFMTIRFLDNAVDTIFVWEPDGQGHWVPDDAMAVRLDLAMLPGLASSFERAEPFVMTSSDDSSVERLFVEAFGQGSCAAVPLFSLGKLRGALIAMSPDPNRRWEESETTLITAVGQYIAHAYLKRDAMRDLNRSRMMFEHLAATSDNGVWLTDAAGRTILMNETASGWLGMSARACPGLRVIDFVNIDAADAERLFNRMLKGRQGSVSLTVGSESGERWIDATVVPLWDESGAFDAALTLLVDVSAKVIEERASRRAAQMDRLAAEMRRCIDRAQSPRVFARDVCRVIVEHGGFDTAWIGVQASASDSPEKYVEFGGSPEMAGHTTSWLRERPDLYAKFYQALERRQEIVFDTASLPGELRGTAERFGVVRSVVIPLAPLSGLTGFLVVLSGTQHDFDGVAIRTLQDVADDISFVHDRLVDRTLRYEAERAHSEVSRLLSAVVESAPIGIMSVDAAGHVTAWNAFAEDATGLNADAALGRQLPELFGPLSEQQACALITHTLNGGDAHRIDVPVSFITGRRIWARVSASPVRTTRGDVDGAVVLFVDLTTQRRLKRSAARQQQRLRASTAELAIALDRERRQIALGLHDTVGQNLAVLSVSMGMLGPACAEEPFRSRHERAMSILEGTIRETRSFTFEISPPILDELGLGPALEWLVDRYREEWPGEWAYLGTEVDVPREPAAILYRSARELLGNAARHAQAQRITVGLWQEANEIRLAVTDNGRGLDEDADLGKYTLGLFGMREQLARLGARLEMLSRPGVGTHAEVALPVDTGSRPRGMTAK